MTRPRIQVVMGEQPVPAAVDDALRRIDATASFTTMQNALRYGLDRQADARIVMADASQDATPAQAVEHLLQSAGAAAAGTIAVACEESQPALIKRLLATLAQTRAARAALQAAD